MKMCTVDLAIGSLCDHFRITLHHADVLENSIQLNEAKLRSKSNVRCPELGRFRCVL
jgi:hypothetical protein